MLAWCPVPEDFSTRFASKTYKYFFTKDSRDIKKMQEAATLLGRNPDFLNSGKMEVDNENKEMEVDKEDEELRRTLESVKILPLSVELKSESISPNGNSARMEKQPCVNDVENFTAEDTEEFLQKVEYIRYRLKELRDEEDSMAFTLEILGWIKEAYKKFSLNKQKMEVEMVEIVERRTDRLNRLKADPLSSCPIGKGSLEHDARIDTDSAVDETISKAALERISLSIDRSLRYMKRVIQNKGYCSKCKSLCLNHSENVDSCSMFVLTLTNETCSSNQIREIVSRLLSAGEGKEEAAGIRDLLDAETKSQDSPPCELKKINFSCIFNYK